MLEELRRLDLADAGRDENAHACDFCGLRGELFADGFWLCSTCAEAQWGRIEREPYAH